MADFTPNYNLKKPLQGENYNIDDQNSNMDIIDTEVKKIDDKIESKINKNDYIASNAFSTTTGTSTAYEVTLDPSPIEYKEGMNITIKPHINCGVNPTLNVNGLGSIALKNNEDEDLGAGDLIANRPYSFVRVGSNFFQCSGGVSNVKNVQRGVTIKKGTDKFIDVDINKVDINKSIIKISIEPNFSSSDYPSGGCIKSSFNNNSSIRLEAFSTGTQVKISWEVIEFNNIKSLQRGESIINAPAELTENISSVNLNKSIIVHSYTSSSSNTYHFSCVEVLAYLKNTNQIAFKSNGSGNFSCAWQVIEFK